MIVNWLKWKICKDDTHTAEEFCNRQKKKFSVTLCVYRLCSVYQIMENLGYKEGSTKPKNRVSRLMSNFAITASENVPLYTASR